MWRTASILALACAASTAQAATAPSTATERLTVRLHGTVSPRCSLAAESSAGDFGDILDPRNGAAAAATLELPFQLECNTPYVATLTSKNGGLLSASHAQGFASSVDYAAEVVTSGVGGGLALKCDSSAMRGEVLTETAATQACRGASSQQYSAGSGRVRLKLRPGGQPLLRGFYSDELVLRVSPDVSGVRS